MAEPKKQATIEDLMKEAEINNAVKNQSVHDDPFKTGANIISAKQLDVDRFATYNSKTYGKLGFDPFKDNNKVYNRNTDWSEDIGRAFTGMFKLAGVGFQDTFGFGLTAGKENWKNFDEVMKNYSSTRGGYTQFWSNTVLSSGYTVGILGAIAAEEVGLALTTGGLGNLGTLGEAGRALNRLDDVTDGSRLVDEISNIGHVDEAAKFFSWKGLGQNLGKLGNKLNPIGESLDFMRKSKLGELSDFNKLQRISLGAGAIARDARKLYMTHSESKLEADLARNEFIDKQIEIAKLQSPDGLLSQDAMSRIETKAAKVHNSTYMGNLGLIYATNAITFDNMFKSMRYSNKLFQVPGKFRTTIGKTGIAVNAVKNYTVKGTVKATKEAIKNFSVKGSLNSGKTFVKGNWKKASGDLLKKALTNSMEGVQEVGQDIISNSVQKYYGRNHAGQQLRGGFLNNMYEAVTNFSFDDVADASFNVAVKRNKKGELVLNDEGVSTFGSGFFMGTIASPFGGSMGYIQRQIAGGGAKSKAQWLFKREEWVKSQKTKYKQALAKAKVLTQIYNAQVNKYLEHTTNELITQSELQEEILDGIQQGDKKKVEDKKYESFQTGMRALFKNNSEGMFVDFLEHMANDFSAEQLNQAMGRTDVTDENINDFKNKLREKAKSVKNLKSKFDEINIVVGDPVRQSDIDRLDISDPEQRAEKFKLMLYKQAHDNLKDELLFSNGKIANKAERMIALQKQLNYETGLSTTETQALLSKSGLESQIKLLTKIVEGNKNLNLQGEDLEKAQMAESKLQIFKDYQKALTQLEKVEKDEESSIDDVDNAYSDLFEAYHQLRSLNPEYGKLFGTEESEEVKRAISRKSFDALTDYLALDRESQALQAAVDTLLNPKTATMWLDENVKMMEDLDKNKETHIANQLIAFEEKAASSEMLAEMQESGIFFDLNELDDLVENGIMPSKIYNIETNQPASKEEYQKAQDIISSFYSRLKGKKITQDKSQTQKSSARHKKDKRTVKTLLRQYGIKLNQEMDLTDLATLEKLLTRLSESKYLTFIEKEVLAAVADSAPKIIFTESGEMPISINEDGVFVIDIRYAGFDYQNARVSFETLVLSALTQSKLNEQLEESENEELKDEISNLMDQAREAFSKKYPNAGAEQMSIFQNQAEFLSEALNNTSFQSFLGGITDVVSGDKMSLWKSLMSKIITVFKKTFDKSVLQRAISLANMALDPTVVDNISVKADETAKQVEEVEETDPVEAVEEGDYKLIEVVPGVWQVTSKAGDVKAFDTKEEAEAYFKEKTGPVKKTVKQTVKKTVSKDVVLGNTEILKNASERPDLFGDFLHPEIVSTNDMLVSEWTNKIAELGAELDAAGVTNWKYGNLRAEVDGALVIDVSAEVPVFETKTKKSKSANAKIKKLQAELQKIENAILELNKKVASEKTKNPNSIPLSEFEARRKEAEKQIKAGGAAISGMFMDAPKISGDYVYPVYPVAVTITNGIYTVSYANAKTGTIDVIASATSGSDFVGFYRLYDGKIATNQFSSKYVNQSRNKANFKTMMASVTSMLPAGHEYTEKVSISTDGLRVWGQQLDRGYELQYDDKGKVITKNVGVNGDSLVNDLGVDVSTGNFDTVFIKNRADFEKAKKALLPYLQKLGLDESNIHWSGGAINPVTKIEAGGNLRIDLPVLKAKGSQANASKTTEQTFEVHVGGIERGYTESKESQDKGVGDIRGLISKQTAPQGVLVTNGATNSATQNDRFVVVYSKVDANGNRLSEVVASGQPRDGWVTTSVKISENATQEEIDNATKAAQTKMNAILPKITGGNFVLSKIDASVSVTIKSNASSTKTNQADSNAAMRQFEEAMSVLLFSKKKFPGKNMPLYQYLRMLNNRKPVVGQFAYYINRNNTSNPTVEKLGVITSFDNNSFTFIDANGKSDTRSIDSKTIEHKNPYFLFTESEVKNDISYDEAEKFIRDIRMQNSQESTTTDNTAVGEELAELQKQKSDLEEKLKNEPETVEFENEEKIQTGTKTVKFMMYKSTGTGSSAASKGEWVPLIAIGKHSDGKEWFVKAYHKGKDPKFDKYGSATWMAIDKDLKDKEGLLFSGQKRTETIEEEIEEEVEVEIEVPRSEAEPNFEEEQLISREDILKSKLNEKRALLKRINEQIASTAKLRFRKRMALDTQKNKVLLEIQELQDEYNTVIADLEKPSAVVTTEETVPAETEQITDENGNVVITHETEFVLLPQDLQDILAKKYHRFKNANQLIAIRSKYKSEIREIEKLFKESNLENDPQVSEDLDNQFGAKFDQLEAMIGGNWSIVMDDKGKVSFFIEQEFTELTEDETQELQDLMKDDVDFIAVIIEYNNAAENQEYVPEEIDEVDNVESPESAEVVELSDEELAIKNAEAISRGKKLAQERIDRQREEARQRRKTRRQAIVPVSELEVDQVTELLKKILKDDFGILSKAEVRMLVGRMMSDSKLAPFKVPDVRAFVNKKKLAIEAKARFEFLSDSFGDELSRMREEERAAELESLQGDLFGDMPEKLFVYNYDKLFKDVKDKTEFTVAYNGKKYKFSITPTEFKALVLSSKDIFSTAESYKDLLVRLHQKLQSVKGNATFYRKGLQFIGTPEEIENQAINLLFDLKKRGLLFPNVISAVNAALYKANSRLVFVRSNALSGSMYSIEAVKQVAQRKAPLTQLEKAKQLIKDFVHQSGVPVSSNTMQDALVAEWFMNPENRVHPDMIATIFRGKQQIRALSSFTSPKSEYKTTDGLGDVIGENEREQFNRLDVTLNNAVIRALSNYKNISELILDVASRLDQGELSEEEKYYENTIPGYVSGQNNADNLESDQDFEDWAKSKMSEEENEDREAYYQSLDYEIITGRLDLTNFDYESLTDAQKLLFDQAVEQGLYDAVETPVKEPVSTETEEEVDMTTEEFLDYVNQPYGEPVIKGEIESEADRVGTELFKLNTDSFEVVGSMLFSFNNMFNTKDLKTLLVFHNIVNNENGLFSNTFNKNQKQVIASKINVLLNSGIFSGKSIMLDGSIWQIYSFNQTNKTVEVIDVTTGELANISYEQFLTAENVFDEGETVENLNVDTVVNDQEITYIKEVYQDIFNNFTDSMSEFNKLDNAELSSEILDQLTKCK